MCARCNPEWSVCGYGRHGSLAVGSTVGRRGRSAVVQRPRRRQVMPTSPPGDGSGTSGMRMQMPAPSTGGDLRRVSCGWPASRGCAASGSEGSRSTRTRPHWSFCSAALPRSARDAREVNRAAGYGLWAGGGSSRRTRIAATDGIGSGEARAKPFGGASANPMHPATPVGHCQGQPGPERCAVPVLRMHQFTTGLPVVQEAP